MRAIWNRLMGNEETSPLNTDDIAAMIFFGIIGVPIVFGSVACIGIVLFPFDQDAYDAERAEEARIVGLREREERETRERETSERIKKRKEWLSEHHSVFDLIDKEVTPDEVIDICNDRVPCRYTKDEKVLLLLQMARLEENESMKILNAWKEDMASGWKRKFDPLHTAENRIDRNSKNIRAWHKMISQIYVDEPESDRKERYDSMIQTLRSLRTPGQRTCLPSPMTCA